MLKASVLANPQALEGQAAAAMEGLLLQPSLGGIVQAYRSLDTHRAG